MEFIVHALTAVPILIIELLILLLTPFKWMKFKLHVAIFVICTGLGCYWYFTDKKHAFLVALAIFVLITIAIAILKWLRKRLKKIDERLLHYFYLYPLENVEINIPIINKKYFEEKNYEKKFKNHYGSPFNYYGSHIVRGDSDNNDKPQ